MSKPVHVDPFRTDEPSIAPPSPGDALVRLSQISGYLHGLKHKANPVPTSLGRAKAGIDEAQNALALSLGRGEDCGASLTFAQNRIREIYASVRSEFADPDEAAPFLLDLGFPDPRRSFEAWVQPVDLSTLTVTHFKPQRQVMTTLSFNHAFGAEAYWLREIIFFADQEVESNMVQNFAPMFQRVRMPIGRHTLRIESRNQHQAVLTDRFEIEVPAL